MREYSPIDSLIDDQRDPALKAVPGWGEYFAQVDLFRPKIKCNSPHSRPAEVSSAKERAPRDDGRGVRVPPCNDGISPSASSDFVKLARQIINFLNIVRKHSSERSSAITTANFVIKRVIGLPGQKIKIEDGIV